MKQSACHIGVTAELYVMFRLSQWGYTVSQAPAGIAYDLFVEMNGSVQRIQVKGTTRQAVGRSTYRFTIARGNKIKATYAADDYDILACVNLADECAIFMPHTDKLRLSFSPNEFDKEQERKSWEELYGRL